MAREAPKSGSGARTAELRRSMARRHGAWHTLLRSRTLVWGIFTAIAFTAACSLLAIRARESPLVAVGRVMRESQTVRVPFEVVDDQATEARRAAARQRTDRILNANVATLDNIKAQIENLPLALVDAQTLDAVKPDLREQFGLKGEWLEEIRAQVDEGGNLKPDWTAKVERLYDRLRKSAPIMASRDQQRLIDAPMLELRVDGRQEARVNVGRVIVLESSTFPEEVRRIAGPGASDSGVRGAGFEGALLELVVARLQRLANPTFTYDQAATEAAMERAATAVPPVKRAFEVGMPLFRKGDALTQADLDRYKAEIEAYQASAPASRIWLRRAGVAGAVALITAALVGYLIRYVPRVRRNPARAGAIAGVLAGALAVACWTAQLKPDMIALAAVAPTIFVAVLLTIAYEQRMALAVCVLHAVLVCLALEQPVGMLALILAGVATAVWQLHDVRDRNTIIRMGVVTGLVLAVAQWAMGLVELPATMPAIEQIGWDSALAAFGGMFVGGLTLFILPTLERAFDITTGMTLIELRDPKQPLLRQLQQRAPGTYNHSLNVASLGEAAADAIGANGLLTYVGALYHDIGKMNKPEYFVENQTPGINRHDKLSPAMSLLIIVGHVKDGLELAREFALPRTLHHFIEAHHGTTLVEFFYHRARKRAAESAEATGEAVGEPSEIEYRYPGPKPHTKEVAIVMLCDAVESAARAMADPTPSRIDAMVRQIANKRLMDGQFDECDLTLRELNLMVETVSKTLAAIYHGRIAYPGGARKEETRTGTAVAAAGADTGDRVRADGLTIPPPPERARQKSA